MSEDAKAKWRTKVSGMADTEALHKRDTEKLVYGAAVALGKAGMRLLAKGVAEQSKEAGLGTYGDLRNAGASFFCCVVRHTRLEIRQMPEAVMGLSAGQGAIGRGSSKQRR